MTSIAILPQPRKMRRLRGTCCLSRCGVVTVPDHRYGTAVRVLQGELPNYKPAVGGAPGDIDLHIDDSLEREAYTLTISLNGVKITMATPAGARHAVQTLRQILRQFPDRQLPCLSIEDAPYFGDRGLYYDACRGRVDTLQTQLANLQLLSEVKLNHLEYYVKHTFTFRNHPLIGKNCGSLTPEEILAMDSACADLGIDFVPSLASFGHMDRILTLKPYRHLAEDWGIGKFVADEADAHHPNHGWTVSPAVPEIYPFLESLWEEYLPLFRSERFNACCDETFDLGWGQSHGLCKELGKGRVFLNHVLKLREIAARFGKRLLIWGDVIANYPELLPELPEDITVINWGYRPRYPETKVEAFGNFRGKVLSSPSSVSHCVLYGAANQARHNIDKHVRAGRKAGIDGILNTCWGDAGMFCSFASSFFGTAYAAERSWNPDSDRVSFTQRFCRIFLNSDAPELIEAVETLNYYSSIHWYFVFFHSYGDRALTQCTPNFGEGDQLHLLDKQGRFHSHTLHAKFGKEMIDALTRSRVALETVRKGRGMDPHGMLPHWILGLDCLVHCGRKLTILGKNGKDTPAGRRKLAREMRALRTRFVTLWHSVSKESELRLNLDHFEKTLAALKQKTVTGPGLTLND